MLGGSVTEDSNGRFVLAGPLKGLRSIGGTERAKCVTVLQGVL